MVTVMSAWEVQDAPISRDAVKIQAACATRLEKAGEGHDNDVGDDARVAMSYDTTLNTTRLALHTKYMLCMEQAKSLDRCLSWSNR